MSHSSLSLNEQLQLGITAVQREQYNQAIKHLMRVLRRDPHHVDALLWLARTLSNPQDRLRIYYRILSLEPGNARAKQGCREVEAAINKSPSKSWQIVGQGVLIIVVFLGILGVMSLRVASIRVQNGQLSGATTSDATTNEGYNLTSNIIDYVSEASAQPRSQTFQSARIKSSPQPYFETDIVIQDARHPSILPPKPVRDDWADITHPISFAEKQLLRAEYTPLRRETFPSASKPQPIDLALLAYQPTSLDEKWIEVNTTTQEVTAWEGNVPVMSFIVSTGLPRTPTVLGKYHIYLKLTSTHMAGPGYNLPNVPYTMYFYRGYALHGAYWHDNFGRPMSHGCVNFSPGEAKRLFDWAGPILPKGQTQVRATTKNPGTLVVVHN